MHILIFISFFAFGESKALLAFTSSEKGRLLSLWITQLVEVLHTIPWQARIWDTTTLMGGPLTIL